MKKWLVGLMAAGLCVASAWAATDTLTAEDFTATSTTYAEFTGVEKDSGAVYAGKTSKSSDGAIQIRSNGSDCGIVTTGSGGTATKVTIAWNAATTNDTREVSVYGKSEAYTAASDLYTAGTQGTLLGSLKKGDGATELEIEGEYAFIGLRSKSGALMLDSIAIEWGGEPTPVEFSIALKPDEDFEVVQGKDASITATVKGAQGDVTYSWSVDGRPIDLAGNVYTVDSADVGGPYEVKCEASDESGADPVSASVKYTVVEAPVVSGEVLTRESTGVTGTSYKDWTFTGESGTVYAGNSAGGNTSIQLNTGSPKGIVITESSGSDVASITVEWNDATADKRSIEIYGSADAYAGPADLYGDAKGELLGTLAKGETTLAVPEGYPFVGILAKGGALYLTSVAFEFAGASGPSVSLSASATEVEVGDELTITATAKNFSGEVSWAWEGDDGGSAEANVYTVNTAAAGEYTVKATATYGEETAEKDIKVTVAEAKVPHAITVTVEGNGTAEADVAEAKLGDTVNLTVTPADGYKVGSITLNGEAISGTSFTMPDEDAAVVVTFVEKPVVDGDVLTNDDVGHQTSSYKDWTATKESGAVYVGQSAGGSTTNPCIQLRSNNNNSGIVMTKGNGQNVTTVTIEWNEQCANGRIVQVYGSATAYSTPADLYGDAKGTLLGAVTNGADEATVDVAAVGDYPYIGIRSKDGALFLSSVTIAFGGEAKPSISGSVEPEMLLGETANATFELGGATATEWTANLGTISDGIWTWTPDEAGTFTLVVTAAYDGGSAEASYEITVEDASTFDRFTKVESIDGLEEGEYLVVGANSDVYFAMTAGLSSGILPGTEVEVKTDEEVPYILVGDDSLVWTVAYDTSAGLTIYNETDKYLGYDSTKADNKLYSFDEVSDASAWAVSETDALFTLTSKVQDKDGVDRCLRFNYNGGNTRFAGYKATSSGMKDVAFFKKGAAGPSISVSGATTVKIPGSFSLQFSVKNYEGAVEWAVTSREGGSISADGLYTWTPTEATDGIEISVTATGEGLELSKTVTLVVEPKDEPGPEEPTLTCTEGTTINATVGQELVLHFTLANAEFYTGDDAESLIGNTSSLGEVSDVTATSFVWTYTPTETGTVTLDFYAMSEGYESVIIESYTVTLNVTEGGGGGDAVTVKSYVVNADGSVTVTLSDGSTTSDGLQYSTDLKNWSTTPVNVKTAASAFVRVGAPE